MFAVIILQRQVAGFNQFVIEIDFQFSNVVVRNIFAFIDFIV